MSALILFQFIYKKGWNGSRGLDEQPANNKINKTSIVLTDS